MSQGREGGRERGVRHKRGAKTLQLKGHDAWRKIPKRPSEADSVAARCWSNEAAQGRG